MKPNTQIESGQAARSALGNASAGLAIPETPESEPKPGEGIFAWRHRVALEAAYKLATYGFACFPCMAGDQPACPSGVKQATSDLRNLTGLWKSYPGVSVGVATGAASGIDILRIDDHHGFWWWQTHRYEVPPTHMHWHSGGGFNFAFQHQAGLASLNCCPVPGCDIIGDNDYVIWWPAEGLPYVHAAPAPWPDWLLDIVTEACRFVGPERDEGLQAVRQQALASLDYAMDHIGTAPAAERKDLLLTHSQRLHRLVPAVLTEDEVHEAMMAAAFFAKVDYSEAEAILAQ